MKNSTRLSFVLSLVLALLSTVALAQTSTQKPETAQPPVEKHSNWYKVNVALHEFEAGKDSSRPSANVNTRNYILMVEDSGQLVRIKTGSRVSVPIAPGSSQFSYLDVGLTIECIARQKDGRLSLNTSVDWNSIAPVEQSGQAQAGGPTIRQLRAEGVNQVTLDKPTLVSSVDDTISKRRYQVEVIVTRQ